MKNINKIFVIHKVYFYPILSDYNPTLSLQPYPLIFLNTILVEVGESGIAILALRSLEITLTVPLKHSLLFVILCKSKTSFKSPLYSYTSWDQGCMVWLVTLDELQCTKMLQNIVS